MNQGDTKTQKVGAIVGLMNKAKEVCNSLMQTESEKNQNITKEDETFNPFVT